MGLQKTWQYLAGTLLYYYAYNIELVTYIFKTNVIFIVDFTEFQKLRSTELMISYRVLLCSWILSVK